LHSHPIPPEWDEAILLKDYSVVKAQPPRLTPDPLPSSHHLPSILPLLFFRGLKNFSQINRKKKKKQKRLLLINEKNKTVMVKIKSLYRRIFLKRQLF